MSAKLLVVDDDMFLLDNLRKLLERSGYTVRTATSGEDALQCLFEESFDLVILDVGLPGSDGITVCRRLREKYHLPVVMLTARTDAMDKVIGLEVGADDYLTKPFEPTELVARVRSHLRRANEYQQPLDSDESTTIGDLTIDYQNRDVLVSGRAAGLTNREFELMAYLGRNSDKALARETIFETVWGYDMDFSSNSLDVYMYRVRKKIEEDPENPKYLLTMRGFGYKLVGAASE